MLEKQNQAEINFVNYGSVNTIFKCIQHGIKCKYPGILCRVNGDQMHPLTITHRLRSTSELSSRVKAFQGTMIFHLGCAHLKLGFTEFLGMLMTSDQILN